MKTDRRPVIGITCSMNDAATRLHANRSYFNAIWKSGGIPVFLPFTDEAKGAREFAAEQALDLVDLVDLHGAPRSLSGADRSPGLDFLDSFFRK